MIIKVILVLICFFCIISLLLLFKNKKKDFFSKLLTITILFIFVHAFHVFICECFFQNFQYARRAIPYGLVYGPLFYFLILGVKKSKITPHVWGLHLIPFLVFSFFYFIFLFNATLRTNYFDQFVNILYATIPLSFVSYIIVSIFQKEKFVNEDAFKEIKEFITTMGMILVFIATLFHVVRFTGGNETPAARLIVYSTMLISVIYIFLHLLRKKARNIFFLTKLEFDQQQYTKKERYTKAKITEEQLDEYEEKLYRFMDDSKIFLDTELSLVKLSKELKIPKYHLTQLLSLRIGKNFNQFVNSYRINFACTILSKNKDVKIEHLIYQCGFNSKSSFNRHFKTIMDITPSEYYSQFND